MQQYQQQQQETVFYQDASPVYISSQRIIVFNQMFVTKSVVSVSMGTLYPHRWFEILLMVSGLFLALVGLTGIGQTNSATIFFPLLYGLGAVGLAVFIWKSKRIRYALLIGNAGGQTQAVVSTNPDYIGNLVNSINTALRYSIN